MWRTLFLTLAVTLSQPACVVVGGYSSDGGFYLWPGSLIGIVVVLIVLILLLRRRRRG